QRLLPLLPASLVCTGTTATGSATHCTWKWAVVCWLRRPDRLSWSGSLFGAPLFSLGVATQVESPFQNTLLRHIPVALELRHPWLRTVLERALHLACRTLGAGPESLTFQRNIDVPTFALWSGPVSRSFIACRPCGPATTA